MIITIIVLSIIIVLMGFFLILGANARTDMRLKITMLELDVDLAQKMISQNEREMARRSDQRKANVKPKYKQYMKGEHWTRTKASGGDQ